MIANGLNGSAPLNRIREFQRFSHNDSLKAQMILISQGVTWSATVATGFTFLCASTLSATASAEFWRCNLSFDCYESPAPAWPIYRHVPVELRIKKAR